VNVAYHSDIKMQSCSDIITNTDKLASGSRPLVPLYGCAESEAGVIMGGTGLAWPKLSPMHTGDSADNSSAQLT
jgi:hypothetical protein